MNDSKMPSIATARSLSFKKAVDPKAAHRSLYDTTIQLRKSRKEENLKKRRNMGQSTLATIDPNTPAPTMFVGQELDTNTVVRNFLDAFGKWRNDGAAPARLLELSIKDVRRLTTQEEGVRHYDTLLQHGVHTCCVDILLRCIEPKAVFEAAWVLTNLTSSDESRHIEAVVNAGAVEVLEPLLSRRVASNLQEQATWGLANIAGDRILYRDGLIRRAATVQGIRRNLECPANVSLIGNSAWAASNLLRGSPPPPLDLALLFLGPVANLLKRGVSGKVPAGEIIDLVRCLQRVTENGDQAMEAVSQSGITPTLVKIVEQYGETDPGLLVPTVIVLSTLASGTEEQTNVVVQSGILKEKVAMKLLDCRLKSVRKNSLFMMSNIASEEKKHIQAIINAPRIWKAVIDMAYDSSWEVKREALWTLTNIVTKGTIGHVRKMAKSHGIHALCQYLSSPRDVTVLLQVLEAIEKILKADEVNFPFKTMFCSRGGVEGLVDLQNHANDDVYELANKILEAFFGKEEEDEDQNIAPATIADDSAFEFGAKQLFPEPGHSKMITQFDFGDNSNMEH